MPFTMLYEFSYIPSRGMVTGQLFNQSRHDLRRRYASLDLNESRVTSVCQLTARHKVSLGPCPH